MDTEEHERTFDGFIKLSKWVAIASVIVLSAMAIFLV
ncbi:aa3-type cytochrome c oxidase subunit IV [Iodidimonas gelatinilytica]|nr:aa3-type cytochrome c oxidase subunit IV [Iodidimonas gelatinilytica]